MRRLQLGIWNRWDGRYWDQYSSPLIQGIEISQYKDIDQLLDLASFCDAHDLKFGIHAPTFHHRTYALPRVTSKWSREREEALRQIEQEVAAASRYGADYILFHYPFPPIFPSLRDESYLQGLPAFEYYEAAELPLIEFKEYSHRMFVFLAELQVRYKQRIVLEYDFFGDFEALFIEMFQSFPDIQLVADVQRLDIHKRVFPGFDPHRWLDLISPYVYLVHYSNVRYRKGNWERHLPVIISDLEDQEVGDAYSYLTLLAAKNDAFHVTFEHNPALVRREELEACYESVDLLLHKNRNKNA